MRNIEEPKRLLSSPYISVIIPVYNVEKYLQECIDSILNQSFQDLEIILINDGSTDGSLSICHEYAEKDTRVCVVNQENRGQGASRNIGLMKAKGKLIHFMDSDDYLSNHTLYQDAVNIFNATDVDCFQFKIHSFSEDFEQKDYLNELNIYYASLYPEIEILYAKEFPLIHLLYTTLVSPCNKIFRRESFKTAPFTDENLKNEDEGFWAYYLAHSPIIYNSSLIAYERRIHSDSTMGTLKDRSGSLEFEPNFDIFKVYYKTYKKLREEGLEENGLHVYARLIRVALYKKRNFINKDGFDKKIFEILEEVPCIPIEILPGDTFLYYLRFFSVINATHKEESMMHFARLIEEVTEFFENRYSHENLLECQLNKIQNDKWYRFGKMSRRRKIKTVGKVITKKIHIYNLIHPTITVFRKIIRRK